VKTPSESSILPPAEDGVWTDDEAERVLSRRLAHLKVKAPTDLLPGIMQALPERPALTRLEWMRNLWPDSGLWVLPSMAGAMAVLLIMLSVLWLSGTSRRGGIEVVFRLHAPEAHSVALAGSFNAWQSGQLVLKGPDAAGYWMTTVRLHEGRHEYLFVVNGEKWITDPEGVLSRPDGFGRLNAIVEVDPDNET
jgi:hypothetical protein